MKRSIRQKFFDFYSIIDLYLKCGGFRDIGYLTYDVFVSYKIEDRIRETHKIIVNKFYEEIHTALITSIKSELRHFPSCIFVLNYDILEHDYGLTLKKIKMVKNDPHKYLCEAIALFSVPEWKPQYGGTAWARGASLLMDAQKIKTLSEKVYWTDQVLDLYHNNGHMINKTKFKCLSENICVGDFCALDVRANSNSILEFLPYNSLQIKRLVIPRKNILTAKQ